MSLEPYNRAGTSVRIATWGVYARRFSVRHPEARVIARFERSIHVAAGDDIVCIVAPELGNGPLNAVAERRDDWGTGRAHTHDAQIGAVVRFNRAGRQLTDDLLVETGSAVVWAPPERTSRSLAPGFPAALAALEDALDVQAGADGLARVALGFDCRDDATARIAGPRLARFRAWLSNPLDHAPPADLLGLGPGLTPSGDDLLCGALIALQAGGLDDMARALGRQIAIEAPVLTTPLSRAFLAAASDGQAAECLHVAVNAVVAGEVARIPRLAADVGLSGHSSGWDALAGVALAMRISFQNGA